MTKKLSEITALTVCHNTKELLKSAVESFREFHPDMKLIIIDGSDFGDPCYDYVQEIASDVTDVYRMGYNIGHGRGMDFGIRKIETRYALIFDSDTVMVKSPVKRMLEMMEPDTYGIGYLEKTAYDGFEYGAKPEHRARPYMYMLHPYFHLIQVSEYFKFAPYVHHGAPCFKAALDIHRKGLTARIIKSFPGLGHTAGKGFVWEAVPGEYILHETAGTRKMRVRKGLRDIEGQWER